MGCWSRPGWRWTPRCRRSDWRTKSPVPAIRTGGLRWWYWLGLASVPRYISSHNACSGGSGNDVGSDHGLVDRAGNRGHRRWTFHYDETGKLIERAITDRANRVAAQHSPITRGSTGYLWHFQPVDEIVDNIIVSHIWRIPQDKDRRAEVDAILDEMHDIFLAFIDFAGDFIWKFSSP